LGAAASLDVDDVFRLCRSGHNDEAEPGSAEQKGKAGYRKGKKTVFRNASATKKKERKRSRE
jgi:hypothetical protein